MNFSSFRSRLLPLLPVVGLLACVSSHTDIPTPEEPLHDCAQAQTPSDGGASSYEDHVARGSACDFTGRCPTVYSDGYGGLCGESGFECVGGQIRAYDDTFSCSFPPSAMADGEPCGDNTHCASGYCYGTVNADGSFSRAECRSPCLPDADLGSYCDDASDCCSGSCCLGCGEREGTCLPAG
jgi:hypothetical protein